MPGAEGYAVFYGTSLAEEATLETHEPFITISGLDRALTYYFTIQTKGGGAVSSLPSNPIILRGEVIVGAIPFPGGGEAPEKPAETRPFHYEVFMAEKAAWEKQGIGRYQITAALRRLVCRHPLEWDKGLYTAEKMRMRSQTFEKYFLKGVEACDVWQGGGNGGIREAVGGPASNSFWFAHPVYFVNRLNDADLLDKSSNPYLGKTITTGGITITVRTNPGFAPLVHAGDNNTRFKFNGEYYAGLTGLFNTGILTTDSR